MSQICDGAACLGIPIYGGGCVTKPVYCAGGNLAVERQAQAVSEIATSFATNNMGAFPGTDDGSGNLAYPRNPALELPTNYVNNTCKPVVFEHLLAYSFSLVQVDVAGVNLYFQESDDGGATWTNHFNGREYGKVSRNFYFPFRTTTPPIAPGATFLRTCRMLIFREPTAGMGNSFLYEITGLAALQHGTSMEF